VRELPVYLIANAPRVRDGYIRSGTRGHAMVRRGLRFESGRGLFWDSGSRCKRWLSCCRDGHCRVPPSQGGARRSDKTEPACKNAMSKPLRTLECGAAGVGDRFWGPVPFLRCLVRQHDHAPRSIAASLRPCLPPSWTRVEHDHRAPLCSSVRPAAHGRAGTEGDVVGEAL
jgi:hypothetical protein